LEEAGFVDPERIGLWGHSMAGNIVFRAFAAKTEIPKVVIWAGAVYTYEDFAEFRISDNSYQPPDEDSPRRRKREELFATYGQFEPESWFWQQVPATNYLDGLTGEIQVHHAANDNVVDIGYSRNLVEVLDSSPIEHELFEYTTGGHNITGSAFTQAMERTAGFLGE
jgi:dipeptidyl aminopeptidase/acylaminoacyl peptidase